MQAGTDDEAPTLGSAGERAALRRIFPRLPDADAALLGPGDDAAVVAAPDGRVVISTDLLVHGPDFRLAWSSFFDLGWKAAATNLADIAAMGAVPTALVVALAAPKPTPLADLEALADGFREACAALAPGVGVVGGDLSASPTLTVAVTVFGDLEGREAVLRSGGRPGDVLALAGGLGRAAAGLALLFGRAVDDQGNPDAGRMPGLRQEHAALLDAQLTPRPPIPAGRVAALAGATAMLDVSDGLLLDAGRIAEASGVRIDLAADALAAETAALAREAPALADRALALVLGGGEDHGLLAAFPPGAVPEGFRPVGRLLDGTGVTLDGRDPGAVVPGWDSFAAWDGAAG
ncbi:thiamine-phosphate kinase [Naasia aerilata]|uniref:Thiamine-monophosphate kinase n=1 Tax=Naasia aerilata TaxID=1162966 RepID=A0ABN6XRM4_9MICO|nr:thiamine-phosphate kinase [Naasia aerilata]BDZ46295.1 thiamine-monophosphate kinase [Naasia aerilata]